MRTLYVIGIGAGDPDYLTIQAVNAIRQVDVFFVLDKGADKAELVQLREDLLRRYADRPGYRVVHARDPDRARTTEGYADAVQDWRRRRADVCEQLVLDELADGQVGAFLVWGDPALYDGTIGIVEDIVSRGQVELEWHVVPGISSISALAARHRIGWSRVGGAVQITTGRRLQAGLPDDVDDVLVMLDAHAAFARVLDPDLQIYWGAYVGTPDELLICGPLGQVADQILAARTEAYERKGWIMDSYLLRRPVSDAGGDGP